MYNYIFLIFYNLPTFSNLLVAPSADPSWQNSSLPSHPLSSGAGRPFFTGGSNSRLHSIKCEHRHQRSWSSLALPWPLCAGESPQSLPFSLCSSKCQLRYQQLQQGSSVVVAFFGASDPLVLARSSAHSPQSTSTLTLTSLPLIRHAGSRQVGCRFRSLCCRCS